MSFFSSIFSINTQRTAYEAQSNATSLDNNVNKVANKHFFDHFTLKLSLSLLAGGIYVITSNRVDLVAGAIVVGGVIVLSVVVAVVRACSRLLANRQAARLPEKPMPPSPANQRPPQADRLVEKVPTQAGAEPSAHSPTSQGETKASAAVNGHAENLLPSENGPAPQGSPQKKDSQTPGQVSPMAVGDKLGNGISSEVPAQAAAQPSVHSATLQGEIKADAAMNGNHHLSEERISESSPQNNGSSTPEQSHMAATVKLGKGINSEETPKESQAQSPSPGLSSAAIGDAGELSEQERELLMKMDWGADSDDGLEGDFGGSNPGKKVPSEGETKLQKSTLTQAPGSEPKTGTKGFDISEYIKTTFDYESFKAMDLNNKGNRLAFAKFIIDRKFHAPIRYLPSLKVANGSKVKEKDKVLLEAQAFIGTGLLNNSRKYPLFSRSSTYHVVLQWLEQPALLGDDSQIKGMYVFLTLLLKNELNYQFAHLDDQIQEKEKEVKEVEEQIQLLNSVKNSQTDAKELNEKLSNGKKEYQLEQLQSYKCDIEKELLELRKQEVQLKEKISKVSEFDVVFESLLSRLQKEWEAKANPKSDKTNCWVEGALALKLENDEVEALKKLKANAKKPKANAKKPKANAKKPKDNGKKDLPNFEMAAQNGCWAAREHLDDKLFYELCEKLGKENDDQAGNENDESQLISMFASSLTRYVPRISDTDDALFVIKFLEKYKKSSDDSEGPLSYDEPLANIGISYFERGLTMRQENLETRFKYARLFLNKLFRKNHHGAMGRMGYLLSMEGYKLKKGGKDGEKSTIDLFAKLDEANKNTMDPWIPYALGCRAKKLASQENHNLAKKEEYYETALTHFRKAVSMGLVRAMADILAIKETSSQAFNTIRASLSTGE